MAPQLCRLVDEPPVGAVWVHEIKFDGYRMQLRVANARAVLRTRKAIDWTERFPEIAREAQKFPDCIMDGEICALDEHGVPNFADLQQALSGGTTENLIYFAFDLLFGGNEDLRNLPLEERKSRLSELLETARSQRFRYVEHFATSGEQFLETACRAHLEGIISKRRDAPYRSGRGDLWTKEKCRGGQEVVIGGWWGSATKIRSILVGSYDGDEFVYRGRIGTGFNSENSGALLRALSRIKQPKSPFTAGIRPPRAREINWVAPKLVAEIQYATITRDGVLRQASFKGLREDKSAKAVVLELPMAVRDAEKRADSETKLVKQPNTVRTKSGDPGTPNVSGVNLSNPEKVFWPATANTRALTKLDLAQYYEEIGPRMLPHIAGRPLSMVRSPEGIIGERFFQRHVLTGVAHVMPIRVKGEAKPFHAISDLKGLVALAQAAVVEIHPWACRPGEPEIPELLIFDLDPDTDLPFAQVIEAAKEMREVLTSCGMTGFAKTTGGKGIHVVTPVTGPSRRPPTWEEAREFAREAAEKLAVAVPGRYVTNMAKRHRAGKIFIDFFRNARMATAVAPWSTRARPGATIATPLSWAQFRSTLDPSTYNLAGMKKVLKLTDPWGDLAESAVSLEDARRKLRAL